MEKHIKNTKGFGIIEILIVAVVITTAFVALAELNYLSLKNSQQARNNLIATNMAIEAIEAVKAIQDENWSTINGMGAGPYLLVKTGTPAKWALGFGNETINGFLRQISFSNVARDGNFDIVTSGGTLDAGTKKVTVTISWTENSQTKSISLSAYITNWKG